MAGIVFQTSFDHYTTVTHRWNTSTGSPAAAISSGNGRNGTASVRFGASNPGDAKITKTLPAAITDIYFAFAYRAGNLPVSGQSRVIAELLDVGTRQIAVILLSDGRILIGRGGSTTSTTVAATLGVLSSFSMLTGVWYHFEIYIRVNSSSGLVQVRVNEVEKLNLSSQNTQATGSNTVSAIALLKAGDADLVGNTNDDFDDVVVRDDQFNGDQQVRCFLPTGIGATNQWTATGAATTREAVDEAAPNDDTDYISEGTVGETSLFTYDSIPTTSTITAVIPLPRAKKTDAGTAKIKSAIRHGGTTYTNGAESAPSDSAYEYHPDIRMTNPGTGVAFTPSDWNAPIEIGPNRSA